VNKKQELFELLCGEAIFVDRAETRLGITPALDMGVVLVHTTMR
jgi:hypothetical protein